jgi:sigma-B regulation protein RsbU (phosphoserine phosphatase)
MDEPNPGRNSFNSEIAKFLDSVILTAVVPAGGALAGMAARIAMPQDKLRLLFIGRDSGFSRRVGEMLGQDRDFSPDIRAASDVRGALAALDAEQFDLVLMEVTQPDGAGLANVALLRSCASRLPIIVAGDAPGQAFAVEAVQAGAHDYLVKSELTPAWLERSLRYAIERHRLERTLLEAEEKYHSVFDHLVEGIFRTTPDGRYLMANAALARIYGYASPEELILGLTDISHRLYVADGRRDEFVRLMQENDTLTGFESQVYRKDGSLIWISENCRAVRDSQARLLYYEGTVEDITLRREAEQKLRRSQALYHSLVETLPQNIFRKDLKGRFTFANQRFCDILGHPLEQIVGKTDIDFFPADLAAKYRHDDQQVLETGRPYDAVEEHRPPGGSKMYVQVVKTPIYEAGGEIIGLQGIFWDITPQRMAEEKIQRAHAELAQNREELRAKNLQMEDDLKMAREIQLAMLPQQYPVFPIPGRPGESAFRFTDCYLPTGSVGGDFFAVSALSDTQASVFLCDVAGHGARSALVTAMIRALVEELKPLATNPGEFLTQLNRDLCAILKPAGTPLLTTAFCLVADSRTAVMRYANAGHLKPLHVRRRAGQVVTLANASGKSQPALGLMDTVAYQSSEVLLSPQDLLVLFTDGLIEVQHPNGEFYTQELLRTAMQQRLDLPAPQLFDQLLAELSRFADGIGFTDDVCLVGMDFAGAQA